MMEFPPLAYKAVNDVMNEGDTVYPREPDGTPHWHHYDLYDIMEHGLIHAHNFLAERNKPSPDRRVMKEELSHFAARACMALEKFILDSSQERLGTGPQP